jgi:MATE family multidrug resistance protein
MLNYRSTYSKIKNLLVFSFPIILGNLGQMLIGAGDVFVAARHGTNTVAAISIANAILMTIFTIGMGLLLSISPVLSKKRGEQKEISQYLKISLLYALIMAIILGFITTFTARFVPFMGFDEPLIKYIQDYMYICSYSFVGAFIHITLKEFLQANEKVFFANFVSIAAIFLNIVLCWLLVFGNSYFQPVGVNGLAIAALIIRSLMGVSLICYCWKYFQSEFIVDIGYLKELFKVGYPMALSMMLEFAAFNFITIAAGRIGAVQVAAHNIVMTLASISFMIPLAVSNAIGVKIGYAYGSKNYVDIKENFFAGLAISLCVMSLCALVFFSIPEALIRIFSTDKNIVFIGSHLLLIVGVFQIFDGTQITISGALRGLSYTKPLITTMLIGYWLIGIPFGIYLAFELHMQIFGLWAGLAVALFSCAGIFLILFKKRLLSVKKELK